MTRTFAQVLDALRARQKTLHADYIGDLNSVHAVSETRLRFGPREALLTEHAAGQLSTVLGVNSRRWMKGAAPEARLAAFRAALSVSTERRKFRLRTVGGALECYAITRESLNPLSEHRLFEALDRYAGPTFEALRFERVEGDGETTQYLAFPPGLTLEVGPEREVWRGGWMLVNSDTGDAALTLYDAWQRAQGGPVLSAVLDKPLLYRTHRPVKNDIDLVKYMLSAHACLLDGVDRARESLNAAARSIVKHPHDALHSLTEEDGYKAAGVHACVLLDERRPQPTRLNLAMLLSESAEALASKRLLQRAVVERAAGAYVRGTLAANS